MSTLQKHKDFVSEPIKDKPISAIAGIGPTYETKLESMKFTKAYHLLGSFLLHDKDEEKFVNFLKDEVEMNADHAKAVFQCLHEWSYRNI